MKHYKAIFFDWDGTAVLSRKAPVEDAVNAMRPLLDKGVKLCIVSGTTYENIAGGKLHSYFTPKQLENLYLGLGRGAFDYGYNTAGEPTVLVDRVPDAKGILAVHDACYRIHRELLEKYGIERLAFLNIEGSFFDSGSSSVSWTYPVDDHSLDNNQYLMIIGSSQNEADTKRECDITFRDLGLVEYTGENESVRKETVLLSGSWTLRMTLHFDGGIVAAENQTLRLPEMTLTVKEVRISALSLSMSICGGEEADTDALFDLLREATLRMKDGKTLKTVGFQAGGSAADCEVGYEFALPVDRTEIAAIEIGGQELLLQP